MPTPPPPFLSWPTALKCLPPPLSPLIRSRPTEVANGYANATVKHFGFAPSTPRALSPAAPRRAFPPRSTRQTRTRHLLAERTRSLRCGCQAPNAADLNVSVMGETAPPAILRSADINRSSQDTQQRRASQTEPVRRGAGGGRTTRRDSSTARCSQGPPSPKRNGACQRVSAHLCHTKLTVSLQTPRS